LVYYSTSKLKEILFKQVLDPAVKPRDDGGQAAGRRRSSLCRTRSGTAGRRRREWDDGGRACAGLDPVPRDDGGGSGTTAVKPVPDSIRYRGTMATGVGRREGWKVREAGITWTDRLAQGGAN